VSTPTNIQTGQAVSVDNIISTRSSAAATWGLAFAKDGTITGQAHQSGASVP